MQVMDLWEKYVVLHIIRTNIIKYNSHLKNQQNPRDKKVLKHDWLMYKYNKKTQRCKLFKKNSYFVMLYLWSGLFAGLS